MNGTDGENILKLLENKNLKIFFSGIGGISMSAIAAALCQKGYKIGGSDIEDKAIIQKLKALGIEIFLSHRAENMPGYDVLVYTSRIKDENPEMIYAVEHNIPTIKRAQMLGALMREYKTSVGVCGTHGKSSTSSMISEIFIKANKNPTFFIGAVYPPAGSAYNIGGDEYFVLEADEYTDSFLNFYPNISVALNIEMDHPDYFKDISAVISSFKAFFANTKDAVVINGDDANAIEAAKDVTADNKKLILYSVKDKNCDIYADNIAYDGGYAVFDIFAYGNLYAKVKLSVPGEFNIYNALAAAACAYMCGIDGKTAGEALSSFKGASRRFEYKGLLNGAKIYEDYAHHPTEIEKTLLGTKKLDCNKLWCVLQPHTYSRTYELFDDLVKAVSLADKVILKEIYSASETNKYNISSGDIAEKVDNAVFIDDFGGIAEHLKSNAQDGDIIVVMGAGDINKLFEFLPLE